MTFSLINELRKELAESEQLITEYTAHAEHYRDKHTQLLQAIRILEANDLVTAMTKHMRDFTLEEEKAHANVLNSIGEVVEENIFDEKPKRRIYTIRNNEPLVKLIIPDHEYEAYRKLWPDDAIEVCVEDDEMSYAADSNLELDYHPSLTKALHPQDFADVLDMLERESRLAKIEEARKRAVGEIEQRNISWAEKPPEWNYVGGTSAIEVAVTKEEE